MYFATVTVKMFVHRHGSQTAGLRYEGGSPHDWKKTEGRVYGYDIQRSKEI